MNSIYLLSKYLSEDEPYSTVFSKKHSVASFFTYPTFWNLIIFGNFRVTTTLNLSYVNKGAHLIVIML